MPQDTSGPPVGRAGGEIAGGAYPLSKLRGLTPQARAALKLRHIATCGQLLRAARRAEDRRRLAAEAAIDPESLTTLVQRADLARVSGIGSVFGMMLEELGVRDVETLAAQDPRALHDRLGRHNRAERIARRSPTLEEVEGWVAQARALPPLVGY